MPTIEDKKVIIDDGKIIIDERSISIDFDNISYENAVKKIKEYYQSEISKIEKYIIDNEPEAAKLSKKTCNGCFTGLASLLLFAVSPYIAVPALAGSIIYACHNGNKSSEIEVKISKLKEDKKRIEIQKNIFLVYFLGLT